MRVLLCGAQKWTGRKVIYNKIKKLQDTHGDKLLVIHGDDSGVCKIADSVCVELGVDRIKVPSNWKGRGRSAGAFRSELMLRMLKPDLVVGFHNDIDGSTLIRNPVREQSAVQIFSILALGGYGR